MAKSKLVLLSSDNTGPEFDLSGGISIGRAEDNRVRLTDETVSRYHAIIEERSGGFWLSDLGSARGTIVNGRLVEGEYRLQNGDLISVGGASLRYLENGNQAATGGAGPATASESSSPGAGASEPVTASSSGGGGKTRLFSPPQMVAAAAAGLLLMIILTSSLYKLFVNGQGSSGDDPSRLRSSETPISGPTSPSEGNDSGNPGGSISLKDVREMVEKLAIRINPRGEVFADEFLTQIREATQMYRTDMFSGALRLRPELGRAANDAGIPAQLMFILAASRSRFSEDQAASGCGGDPAGLGVLKVPRAILTQFGESQAVDQRRGAEIAARYLNEMMGGRSNNFIYAVACFGQSRARIGAIEERNDPQALRNFWELVAKGEITAAEAQSAVCFFAAGIVAENPDRFGVSAKSFTELY